LIVRTRKVAIEVSIFRLQLVRGAKLATDGKWSKMG